MQAAQSKMAKGALTLFLGAGFGCGGAFPEDEDGPIVVDHETFAVAADPPGGEFSGPITVSLYAEEPATIYYTLDGEAPADSGVEYEGPIELEGDVMLTFAGVNEEGVWSRSVVEHYMSRGVTGIPSQTPRILSLSRPQLYFSARPGDGLLHKTVYATSVGTEHVMIHRVRITSARETGGFYEPGVFRLETPVPDSTLLAPGERIELRISYRPTETLRSAALAFETDDMRTETGVHEIRLSGRIFNW